MATLTPTLTLVSTDLSSDSLSITATDSLTVTQPNISTARISVSHSSKTNILENNSTTTYVYVKNTDSSNHVKLFNDSDQEWGIIFPGEFAFFGVTDNLGFRMQANNAACVVEYAYFTKG